MPDTVFDQLNQAFFLTTQPLESQDFYRRLLSLLIQTTQCQGVTLWLLQGDELILADHLEARQGVLRELNVPEDQQAEALKKAFGEGAPQLFVTGEASDPPEQRHTVLFMRIGGIRQPLGVLRIIAQALNEEGARTLLSVAQCFMGYGVLKEALQHSQRQEFERGILEKLGRSSVALHSSTLTTRFATTAVNTATEVINVDRVSLLLPIKKGRMKLEAVSAVDYPDAKSAWNRALTEMSEEAITLDQPLRYVEGQTDPNDLPTHIRDKLAAYVQVSECKVILLLPLRSRTGPVGLLVLETWDESALNEFETAAATVYASHVAIALDNSVYFSRLPFSGHYARKRDKQLAKAKPPRRLLRHAKWFLMGVMLIALIAYFGFVTVDETVSCQCQVQASDWAVVVPKVSGEIRRVNIREKSQVRKGEILFEFDTDKLMLNKRKLEYEIEQIARDIRRLQGEAVELAKGGRESGGKIAEAGAREAEMKAKQQELELVELNIRDSMVRAPIDGIIIEPTEPEQLAGRVVSQGDPLCRIANLSRLRIDVAVEEPELPEVKEGQEVKISLEALLTDQYMEGKIKHIHMRSTVFKNMNVFMAEVYVDNEKGILKQGMTGKALIKIGRCTYFQKWYKRGRKKVIYWWF